MGREASFELDCSEFSGSVTDFIMAKHDRALAKREKAMKEAL